MNDEDTAPFDEPIFVTRPIIPPLNEYYEYLKEIWDSQWFTNNGQMHRELERRIKEYLKVKEVSLFNNGTIALITACRALRLSGEVITTPFTFAATPHILTWNGIKPIFCDITSLDYNIDSNLIEDMITPETTGIMPVHVFGHPCDVISIQDIADRYGLKVIYDAAHAFGVEYCGQGIGTYGDCSAFSFHATKMFHTAEGGALSISENSLKDRIELLKNFGIKNEDEVTQPGINGKMSELSAALGLVLLEYVKEEKEKRKKLSIQYNSLLQNIDGISLQESSQKTKSNYQYYSIKIDPDFFGLSRENVYENFKKYNVFSRKYFYPLCSNFSCYKHLHSASKQNLPNANEISEQILCLPLYGKLTSKDVNKICSILISMKG